MKKINGRLSQSIALIAGVLMLSGCHTDMWRQPKAVSQETTDFWADGQVDRPKVAGTVAFGKDRTDEHMYRGRVGGKLATTLPPKIVINGETLDTTEDLEKILKRGKERFNINCTHCHGAVGDGKGMIAIRGLELKRSPATYHTDRLRKMPIGHFYDVMSNGYGVMMSPASRIEPGDRWAIAAYLRVLQKNHVDAPTPVPTEGADSHGH